MTLPMQPTGRIMLPTKALTYKRYIPIFIILILVLTFYISGLSKYITLESIKQHKLIFTNYVNEHDFLAPILFILCYIVLTTMAMPIDTLLMLIAGFLFPMPYALLYVIIGASTGATCLNLAAKTAFGDFLYSWTGPFIRKLEDGFKANAASYMLFLRLVPIFPFWLVNIAPAFLGIPIHIFYWTTLIGIIPYAVIFTIAGEGLGKIMDSNAPLNLYTILNPQIVISLMLMGCLALTPLLVQKYFKKSSDSK